METFRSHTNVTLTSNNHVTMMPFSLHNHSSSGRTPDGSRLAAYYAPIILTTLFCNCPCFGASPLCDQMEWLNEWVSTLPPGAQIVHKEFRQNEISKSTCLHIMASSKYIVLVKIEVPLVVVHNVFQNWFGLIFWVTQWTLVLSSAVMAHQPA